MEETNDYLNKVGSFDGDTSFKDIKKFVKGEVEDHEQVLEDACEDCEDGTRVSFNCTQFYLKAFEFLKTLFHMPLEKCTD